MSSVQKKMNSKGQKLSQEEVDERLKEKFPKRYTYLYSFVVILFIVGVLAGLFVFLFGLIGLQSKIYSPHDAWLFASTGLSSGIFGAMSLIFAIIMSALIFFGIAPYFLFIFIPRFKRFLEMMSLKQGWRSIFSFQMQMFLMLKILFVICIVATPLLFLSLNNYSYVTQNGACLNTFFNFHERCYSWKEISKVSIAGHMRSRTNLYLAYVLHFDDGEKVDLWNTSDFLDKITKIDQTLVLYNIPFEVESVDEVARQKINDRFSGKYLQVIRKILRI